MATLGDDFKFNGAVGTFTFYRKKGSDKVFVRARHHSGRKKKLKEISPRSRENSTEFGTRSTASKGIRHSITHVKHLADYNFTSQLNSLTRQPQKLDPVSARGERNVLISQHTSYFAGFNLNKNNLLDSIIRHPLQYSIDTAGGKAIVLLPALRPGVSLFLPWPVPQYKVIMSLGLVGDHFFGTPKKDQWWAPVPVTATTGWLYSTMAYEEQSFELSLAIPEAGPKVGGLSYVLSIGIEWEFPMKNGQGGMRKAGAAKIVEMKAVEI